MFNKLVTSSEKIINKANALTGEEKEYFILTKLSDYLRLNNKFSSEYSLTTNIDNVFTFKKGAFVEITQFSRWERKHELKCKKELIFYANNFGLKDSMAKVKICINNLAGYLNYNTHSLFRRNGYAFYLSKRLLGIYPKLFGNVIDIYGLINQSNFPSQGLIKKLGFRYLYTNDRGCMTFLFDKEAQ